MTDAEMVNKMLEDSKFRRRSRLTTFGKFCFISVVLAILSLIGFVIYNFFALSAALINFLNK